MDKELLIVNDELNQRPKVEVSWSELFYSVKTKKGQLEVLKGVNGIAEPGEILAIMGASGAGKSSLLNALADKIQPSSYEFLSGEVLANGQNIKTIGFSSYIGYVTQDDVLIDCLTVRECLIFSGRLKLKDSYNKILEKVDGLIKELMLGDCQDTFIGSNIIRGISGGEKKRTNIGTELITDPSVLFLDEPTSGLDSFTATVIFKILVELARKGRTIIASIHQPNSDIYHMFDKLLLMSEGYIVYHGVASQAVRFFERAGFICPEHCNPADYFIQILHVKKPHDLDAKEQLVLEKIQKVYKECSFLERKQSCELARLERKAGERVSSFHFQLYMNVQRFALRVKRNPMLSYVKIVVATFFGLMLNIFYWQIGDGGMSDYRNRNGALFFFVVTLLFTNIQSTILSFPILRSLLIREYHSNMYGISSFFIAKNLVDLVMEFFITIYLGNLVYWGIGFTQSSFGHILYFFVISFFVHMSGGSLGFFCGSLFKSPEVALNFTSLILIPNMYFSGFYRSGNIPDAFKWLENLSVMKYGFQGIAKNEWDGVGNNPICYGDQNKCETPLEMLDITMSLRASLGYLILILVVIRGFALLVLFIKVKTARI